MTTTEAAPEIRSSIFSPEHEVLRASARAFIERELAPHADEWEEAGDFPDWVFERAGAQGFLGLSYPEEYGGQGGDYLSSLVLKEEMARCGSGSVGMALAVQSDMATPPILKYGTEEQKQRYLVPAIKGTRIACLAITEPEAGSDVANVQTTAVRDGSEWVINGRKIFITNGCRAHFCTLVARTDRGSIDDAVGPEGVKASSINPRKPSGYQGFSLFLVDTDTPGWQVAKRLKKLGMHASDTAEIVIEDCRVPANALLGEEGKGFYQIMWELQGERLAGAAGSVSGAQLMFDRALEYAKERHAFGKPIGANQAISHRLAEMATEIEAARQLVYDAAWRLTKGEYPVKEISMAKLYGGLVACRVANHAMQVFGGASYLMDVPIQRAWRDARLIRIGGGADEIMREIIAKTSGL
ncbi:MAG: acyl-CoA dehydrogenase family protein [Acidobacteria bacterium]|nr:acyl-CoA dehydrogenase family protein [Acidobacteriota bacterium]